VTQQQEVLPEWYRDDGTLAPLSKPLLPEYTLWVSLHGGNGQWAQQRAFDLWEKQQNDHATAQRDFAIREEHRLAMEAEAERRRKAEEEARRALFNTAEQERRRTLAQEEAERLAREAEAEARRKKEAEERERRRQQPRPCEKCSGTGKCTECSGDGFVPTFYLSCEVQDKASARGRLPRGCPRCGGSGDGAFWGPFVNGSGKCAVCNGHGMVRPPPKGWSDV